MSHSTFHQIPQQYVDNLDFLNSYTPRNTKLRTSSAIYSYIYNVKFFLKMNCRLFFNKKWQDGKVFEEVVDLDFLA